MTVKELIEKLKEFDDDMDVRICTPRGYKSASSVIHENGMVYVEDKN